MESPGDGPYAWEFPRRGLENEWYFLRVTNKAILNF